MTIFDLLFLACFLATVVSLLRSGYYACRRRWVQHPGTQAARLRSRGLWGRAGGDLAHEPTYGPSDG